MTTLHAHQTYVEEHPFETVPALALADRLQEESNGSRWDALRFVAALRKPGRDARFMSQAAKLMRSTSFTKIELDALIQDQAGVASYEDYTIYLVSGFAPPDATHATLEPLPDNPIPVVVTVGCRWVLLYYRLLLRIVRQKTVTANFGKDLWRRVR